MNRCRIALAASVAVALSPAVAAELSALPWRRVITAGGPTETAIVDVFAQLAGASVDQDR